jgi:DNA modification methylase
MGKKMKKLETNKVYEGNSLDVLKTFPDESLDMCVTSPPYWGLRNL